MATKAKSKFTPDEIRKSLEILKEAGQQGGYAYESVIDLLPPGERPPVTAEGSVAVKITEATGSSDTLYSQADWKKIKEALLHHWQPITIVLGGKKGTVQIEVDASEDHPLDW